MTEEIELGPNWHEHSLGGDVPKGTRTLFEYNENGVPLRSWVYVEPFPPLPTAPYTVIRVTWKEGTWYAKQDTNPILIRQPEGAYHEWAWSDDGDSFGDESDLRKNITDFKVLAAPDSERDINAWASLRENTRRETIKEVINVFAKSPRIPFDEIDRVRREMGIG